MNALAEKLIAAVKDETAEDVNAAFFTLCTYLDTEKHAIGDGDLAIAFTASTERRGKTYQHVCALLQVAMRRPR
jgi:hypothetical protein